LKNFVSKNLHWLIFLVIIVSFFVGFRNLTYSLPTMIAIIFGGIGFLSFGYLAFYTERQKRKQTKEEER
jgi:hypothetical protein